VNTLNGYGLFAVDGFGSWAYYLFPTRIRATGPRFFWNDLLLAAATAHVAPRPAVEPVGDRETLRGAAVRERAA